MARRKIASVTLVDSSTGTELETVSVRTETDAVEMPDGTRLTDKLRQMEIAGDGSVRAPAYVKTFLPADFTRRIIKFVLTVPALEHGLGVNVTVRDCMRLDADAFGSILCQYTVLANGDVTVTADDAFAGKIILEGYECNR